MIDFEKVGRLPASQDNCAIAIDTLEAGIAIRGPSGEFTLDHTILEGHRFAVRPISSGAPLLSWGMPFGRALRDIDPGEYVCNERVLNALSGRRLQFELPPSPNFADDLAEYHFDRAQFRPAPSLPHVADRRTFLGYQRPGSRGVGTRNTIVLLGVNALTAGFAKRLEQQLNPLAQRYENVDGIVAVAHTEGAQAGSHNQELLLRTLAGFAVHPNTGAVLFLDAGPAGVTNQQLRDHMEAHDYPLHAVQHQFVSLRGPLTSDLQNASAVVQGWLPQVNGLGRTPCPLSELKIALQCGGSDAFSGISGNPLAALVSKKVIQAGGSAVLAETDELIGAESYILDKVRDAATVEQFLTKVARFQERVAWHGHSAHGNPSGGNIYRGLYNIYLKSLGAAAKRHPDVPLDFVIDYGRRLDQAGYYFMDSPGNDLESIAGQVATGCNLIYFVTGNGSITNFPFVPTIKIVTTSARYALLPNEMDVNAGAYLDGASMDVLAEATLVDTLEVASGRLSAGEKAHHAQVQIWRNWPQNGPPNVEQAAQQPRPEGQPLTITEAGYEASFSFSAWQNGDQIVSDRVGLILPSSLCSGQIAHMAAQQLNSRRVGREKQISRFSAVVHTEGCGVSTQREFVDTLLGHLAHPLVASCLILEHGCEITHNDYWRAKLEAEGLPPERFGWASVQLDGGIENVLAKIIAWMIDDCASMAAPEPVVADLSGVRLGLMTADEIDGLTAVSLAQLAQLIVGAGGTVVLPANDPLVANPAFGETLPLNPSLTASLAFAQRFTRPGFHLMASPTRQWSESMTGLGATGIELFLTIPSTRSQAGHPFIPVLAAAEETALPPHLQSEVDVLLQGNSRQRCEQILIRMSAVLSRTISTASTQNDFGFQVTRGQLGVSL